MVQKIFCAILVLAIVLSPALSASEADLYGLHAAGEADGFAEAALKLGEYRKMEPGPVEEFLLYDHPSGKTRIRMAMDWKAEKLRE